MIDGMNFEGVSTCNWREIKAIEGVPGITIRNLWTGDNNKRVDVYEF